MPEQVFTLIVYYIRNGLPLTPTVWHIEETQENIECLAWWLQKIGNSVGIDVCKKVYQAW